MNTTNSSSEQPLVSLTTPEFVSFLAGAQKITTDYLAQHFQALAALERCVLVAFEGPRYIKIARENMVITDGQKISASAHCFIDRMNGDVLKADSWVRPAKGARGNIFDERNGLGRMGEYGPAYNR